MVVDNERDAFRATKTRVVFDLAPSIVERRWEANPMQRLAMDAIPSIANRDDRCDDDGYWTTTTTW